AAAAFWLGTSSCPLARAVLVGAAETLLVSRRGPGRGPRRGLPGFLQETEARSESGRRAERAPGFCLHRAAGDSLIGRQAAPWPVRDEPGGVNSCAAFGRPSGTDFLRAQGRSACQRRKCDR